MTNHISARVAWHDGGWNGRICKRPKENTYCVGEYSYPGDLIAEERDLGWETKPSVAGRPCSELKRIPPCAYSINAFGKDAIRASNDPPAWITDGTKTRYWDMPPATVCIWPYEEMYADGVKVDGVKGQRFDYGRRLERAQEYFSRIEAGRSLVIYYANYSNPFSEEDFRRYAVVGISRVKEKGKVMFYEGMSEENRRKYAGGFIWQLPITSTYPEEGFCIPFHKYRDDEEKMSRLLYTPENDRNFKYATRHISDDDALDIVERLLEIVDYLIDLKDESDDWELRKKWLESLVSELWVARGVYPGLPKILDLIGFQDAIPYFKQKVMDGLEEETKIAIFAFVDGKGKVPNGLRIKDEAKARVLRQWRLRSDEEQKLLRDIFPRFDLTKDQLERILPGTRVNNGLLSPLNAIYDNPYILSEEFIGDDVDDRIPFNKIDHGVFPSPEMGLSNLVEVDNPRRLRALCVEQLRRDGKHTFISASKVLADVNRKLSHFPDWKSIQFTERYLEVDAETLSGALTMREEDGRRYLYLKSVFEDERKVEKEIRSLGKRSDIKLKVPVIESTWRNLLYDGESRLAKSNPKEYDKAIQGQVEVCQKVFTKPICIISGAAGTGKTTIIRAVIEAIEKAHGHGTPFQLLAPTGKAADRIREKTGKDASTIHSFLARRSWLNDNMTFRRAGGAQEAGKSTYIIDESSMLDLELTAALFRSINWATVQRLIFVGDHNQLPPIGRGKVFAEVIEWLKEQNPDAVGVLKTNIRQMENRTMKRGTGILSLASIYQKDEEEGKAVAEDILSRVQEGGEVDKDLRVVYWKDTDELEESIRESLVEDLSEDLSEEASGEVFSSWMDAHHDQEGALRTDYSQIISPYRGELFGTGNINLVLQEFINKKSADRSGLVGGIAEYDKVIQFINRSGARSYWAYNRLTKKKQRVEVFNGEMGFSRPHPFDRNDSSNARFQVIFSRKDDLLIDFTNRDVEENIELAYAISVHKSQGSEFERVYFVLPKHKKSLLSSELLYTGITRAQRHLTMFIQEDFSPLLSLRRKEMSHLLAINSSLFAFKPVPEEIMKLADWYEEGKIHQTLSEYMVRSKSEVIIANMLHGREIPFKYEVPLFAPDGTFYLPDFTVTWNGEEFYWEHLGMLDRKAYNDHWNKKKRWYSKNFPDRLITTEESGRLSKDAEKVIEMYFTN